MKMYVLLFKNWKHVFKHMYQTAPKTPFYLLLLQNKIQKLKVGTKKEEEEEEEEERPAELVINLSLDGHE